MSGRQFPIFPILTLIAIVLGAYWIYKNVELVEVDYQVGRNEEARNNQFLAAARLLQKETFTFNIAKDRSVFSSLDISETDVLWLADLNELSSDQELDELYTWIESGGILLTSPLNEFAFNESTVSGAFLAQIGITPLTEFEQNSPTYLDDVEFGFHTLSVPQSAQSLQTIDFIVNNKPYFKSTTIQNDTNHVSVDTPYLIQKSIGQGYVTVYADGAMFNNDNIDALDHGYLLLWLTEPAKLKKLSIVFKPAAKPGLFHFLWSRFTLAILLSGLLLIGFLRWASSRLGPVEQETAPIQNNIMAHLQARGEYWYRHNYTDKVAKNVQHAARDNVMKQHGLSEQAQSDTSSSKSALVKQASKMLQCSPVTAENALYGKVKKDSAILDASRVLQKINHRKPFQP